MLFCCSTEETDDDAQQVQRRTDHWHPEGARGGPSAAELCRKHGISEPTLYKLRSKSGGMEVSDARWPKALEKESARLKNLLAESMPDVLECVSHRGLRHPVHHTATSV